MKSTSPYLLFLVKDEELGNIEGLRDTDPLLLGNTPESLLNLKKYYEGPLYPSSRIFAGKTGVWIDPSIMNFKYFLRGPIEKASLTAVQCAAECAVRTGCTGFAWPGCYLLNMTAWNDGVKFDVMNDDQRPMALSSLINPEQDLPLTMVYVKETPEVNVKGLVGYPKVATFDSDEDGEGVGADAALAYLNRPTTCSFDSKGNVLLTDTWNQRIRKVVDLHRDCHHHRSLNTKKEIEDYISKTANMDRECASIPPLAAEYVKAQGAVLRDDPTWEVFDGFLCNFTHDVAKADHLKSLTQNLLVLCRVCDDENTATGQRPEVCPDAECRCRTAVEEVAKTSVYLNCPKPDARFDKRHRFITAYIRCFSKDEPVSTDELKWLTDPVKQKDLKEKLYTFYGLLHDS